jgi:demethylmenaquinone methyltransferase/2-methoxy-6-polyprenyl-1,4-benzoquinol methylase
MKEKNHQQSSIEISGFKARFYDYFIFLGTLGLYQVLLKRVIRDMNIRTTDWILDMGAGSGKNARLMLGYLSNKGKITALEIGDEMKKQFTKKCEKFSNASLMNLRIENPLPFTAEFDKVFISYVIHGFKQDERVKIVQNAYRALKPGGKLFIFDWNEFDLGEGGIFIRFFMKYIECEEAGEFIRQDFKKILSSIGFRNLVEHIYAKNKIRLLSAEK